MDLDLARRLHRPADSKILWLVLDGLGGLPHPDSGLSELETAHTPHLDALAGESALGLSMPVGYGITPGSGPGHLALFGYDPLQFDIGRGVLEATGIGFPLEPSDVAARGNFCTLAGDGTIRDRRAGRLPSEQSAAIVERLRSIRIAGLEVFVEPVREHRFVLVLRGAGLSAAVSETDPQAEGVAPLPSRALTPQAQAPEAQATAAAVNEFVARAAPLIADEPLANGLVLRGFATIPALPQMSEVWGLTPASCAIYPMYRGLARLAGMTAIPAGNDIGDQIAALGEHWPDYDYFFCHYKYTDSAGEDGDFDAKVERLQEFDAALPALRDLGPDVLVVSGDHSTPAVMAAHSWHPAPFLLHSRTTRRRAGAAFSEADCARGMLGTFPAKEALPLAMAHAGRLAKYGA